MKEVYQKIALLEAMFNGSLDGIKLYNTSDVLEKITVVEMINDFKKATKQIQNELDKEVKKQLESKSFYCYHTTINYKKCSVQCNICKSS